jgi:hypothetical protein
MAIDPLVIRDEDIEKWGLLVKSWATGVNKLEDGGAYPIPQSLQELKDQMTAAGMTGFVIPPRIKAVQFSQYNLEVLYIRLPPKVLIEENEQKLRDGAPYVLRSFYKRIYVDQGGPANIPQNEKLKVHAERIGDYTMSACM